MAIVKTKIRDVKKGDKWTSKSGYWFGWIAQRDARPDNDSPGDFELNCVNEDGQRGWFGGYDPDFVIEVERAEECHCEQTLDEQTVFYWGAIDGWGAKRMASKYTGPGTLRRLKAAWNRCLATPVEDLEDGGYVR